MKQFLTAILMGFFGALATLISFSFHLPSWVLFLTWVSYYLFGKSVKSALQTLLPLTCGILMGITIKLFGSSLSIYLGNFGFPIAVFILITSLSYLSKIKRLENIPAWFIGLIIFFGVHPKIEIKPMIIIFIAISLGFVFAYLNDTMTRLVVKK
ncbi:DUF1097 domain-containing protein [Winogradskyella endarachnes]|uniref:DUF1097 domain-containing protein n=1 Tax=Winogradskyella endarachnes TaxID=2681965 RepID=A0A6L6UDL5_9FLAO|nr:DUF1097 domain-containing protein [Winogradskyella endarachnes]MUU78937.1 DUF1097 domain-containing protein [Winogradskyella endarachnes]